MAHGAAVGADPPPGEGRPGATAIELAATGFDVVELLELLGSGLRDLHATAVGECPFDAGNAGLLERAADAVAAGTVDPDRFDRAYRRSTPDELLHIVSTSRPAEPDPPVVIHGSAALDAVRVEAGTIVGWDAVERSGRGDRYRDLATMAISLVDVVGPEALGPFLDAYGIEHPDVLRLDWHVMVDQLLRSPAGP
ncbi:MAG: phosphotransferase [Acidimicrobiales bacterium]